MDDFLHILVVSECNLWCCVFPRLSPGNVLPSILWEMERLYAVTGFIVAFVRVGLLVFYCQPWPNYMSRNGVADFLHVYFAYIFAYVFIYAYNSSSMFTLKT